MIRGRFSLGGGFADTPTAHTDDMQSVQHNGSMAGRAALPAVSLRHDYLKKDCSYLRS